MIRPGNRCRTRVKSIAGDRGGKRRAARARGGGHGHTAGSPGRRVKSWNAGDLDGYLSLYDEGIALYGYSPEPMNKDQVRGFYQGILSAFGAPKLEFHEVLWDGDVATIRFTMTGRHVDEFMGVPASGTAIALPGITILHFRGDRVIALLPGGYAGPADPGWGRAGAGLNPVAGFIRRSVGMGDRSVCRP